MERAVRYLFSVSQVAFVSAQFASATEITELLIS